MLAGDLPKGRVHCQHIVCQLGNSKTNAQSTDFHARQASPLWLQCWIPRLCNHAKAGESKYMYKWLETMQHPPNWEASPYNRSEVSGLWHIFHPVNVWSTTTVCDASHIHWAIPLFYSQFCCSHTNKDQSWKTNQSTSGYFPNDSS